MKDADILSLRQVNIDARRPLGYAEDAVVREAARLRHRVFCEHKGWESPRADGEERNRYDSHAIHSVLLGKFCDPCEGPAERVIAYQRVIISGDRRLPLLDLGVSPDPVVRDDMAQGRIAELSRFCIDPDLGNVLNFWSDGGCMPIRATQINFFMGWMALISMAPEVHSLAAILEPSLKRQLDVLNIETQEIAEPLEHRGKRHPISISLLDDNRLRAWKLASNFRMILGTRLILGQESAYSGSRRVVSLRHDDPARHSCLS